MHHIKVMRVIAIAARSNLAIFSLLFLFLLLLDLTTVTKTTERHVVGFLNFAWPLNIINKNSEEKNIFLIRPPPAPLGQFLGFLRYFWPILEGGKEEF